MDFQTLFPLKEKSRWIYGTDRGYITVAVTERQTAGGKNFYLVETSVDNEVMQREKYLVDVDTLWLISRNFGTTLMVYDPPNPVLVAPPQVGKSWEWKGSCGGQELQFHFSFTDKDTIEVPAGRFPSIKMEIQEKSSLGESTTFRWFSQGIGMVMESSASDFMNFVAQLEAYKLGKD